MCKNKKNLPILIDLCCGMGGISLAARNIGLEPIAGVDINEKALKTYSRNFPNAITINGDIANPETINKCIVIRRQKQYKDRELVVVSGPPCQGFSVAGKRDPNDLRNDVLFSVGKAIIKLKPTFALIENVSALLMDIHRRRVARLTNALQRAEYYVTPIVLDAQEFGVPQKRRRVFFYISNNFLEKSSLEKKMALMKTKKITVFEAFVGLKKPQVRPKEYIDEREKAFICNHLAMRHSKKVKEKISSLLPGTGPLSYRRLDPAKPANTLISGHRAPPAHFTEPRSITVREAARLQGFPDSFRIYGHFGSQMEQVTNAVPPSLAKVALLTLLGD